MSNERGSAASAGGKARAIQQKLEALDRKENYNKNPNLCLYCEKGIFASDSEKLFDVLRKRFCGHSCSAQHFNHLRPRKDTKSKQNRAEVSSPRTCSKCSSEFTVARLSSGSFPGDKICVPCKPKPVGTLQIKEVFSGKKNWQTARSCIQKHARAVYQESGFPSSCLECGYERHVELCHIKPVHSFQKSALVSEVNNLHNLIALCRNHHWELDHGFLSSDHFAKAALERKL